MTTLTPPTPRDLPVSAPPIARVRRGTPLRARGEPAVWLMGAALITCVTLIATLLALIVGNGLATFWPDPIDRVTLRGGETFLGVPVKDEVYDAGAPDRQRLAEMPAGAELISGAIASDGRPVRRLYRVGNRELGQQPFRWVPLFDIASVDRPTDALLLERREWGVWLGMPEAILERQERVVPVSDQMARGESATPGVKVTVVGKPTPDGQRILVSTPVASGADVREKLVELLPQAQRRFADTEDLKQSEIGHVNAQLEGWRRRVRAVELELADAKAGGATGLSMSAWLSVIAAFGVALTIAIVLFLRMRGPGPAGSRRRGLRIGASAAACASVVALAAVVLERPTHAIDAAAVDSLRERAASEVARLEQQYAGILERVRQIEAEDARFRLVINDVGTGRFAPVSQTAQDEPLKISQIVRAVPANDLTFMGKVGVYLDRWVEFLTARPREANTEGGVMPVIFGTVLLTILLSITVVPLGVIAALYLREYAKQGLVTSVVRIAVNNLAGVPSIVYGVFGLGFFCYTLGQYIDAGPGAEHALPRYPWWFMMLGAGVAVFAALALAILAKPKPGQLASRRDIWFKRACVGLWAAAAVLVVALFATTPYFNGFYRAALPNPTFGSRGILWGALTLALLTLPVVIVATEEALAAVPRSMREGSYGCGASRWQTIKRIVLPGAMPGIMTGMILAMARGAGEVAPLMLVGAVKLAPTLPIGGEFPFVHLERSFMHLGFHIYDLGFQSPDAEAARPLVWTTTLLLITIVVLLNLVAITIRSRLRARLSAGQF